MAGFSSFGLAGLTAVDYLVDRLELTETGHLRAEDLPAITPFENGVPRHHTRLFSGTERDVTILIGELFIPSVVSGPFAETILEWTAANGVEEIAVLSGVPIPHAPDDHRTYYVATEDYRAARLDGTEVPPMGQGFLDGTNAALLGHGIDSPLAVGVYITPVHAQTPDVDAAIRLIETVDEVYDLGVDSGPLQDFAREVQQYYAELADRIERRAEDPEDRMFM